MTTRSVDNFSTINDVNDVQDYLLDPNCLFPSSALNNVPNGINTGQYPIWENSSSSYSLSGFPSVRLGSFAGAIGQDSNAIAIGTNSGRHEQATLGIAIGWNCARTHQGSSAIAIGSQAGSLTQGQNGIAIGELAGQQNQQFESIAIGKCAGQNSQGTNSIAIGSYAGQNSAPNNSIIINATGIALNPTLSNALFIDPVRFTTTGSNLLSYDSTNKEVSWVNNLSLSNPLVIPSGSVNTCSLQISGTPSTGIFSSGTDVLNLATGGGTRVLLNSGGTTISNGSVFIPNGTAAGPAIRFSSSTTSGIYSSGTDNFSISTASTQRLSISSTGFVTVHTSQLSLPSTATVSLPGLVFGGDTNSGIYRIAEDNIGISTNGILRFNIATTAMVCSLPLQLQTTGGTASNLDYYEQLSHVSSWDYGNQTNVESSTIKCDRIGRLVCLTLNLGWATAPTNTNGSNAVVLSRVALPSRFRPNDSIFFPSLALLAGTMSNNVRLVLSTAGILEFAQPSGTGFASGTSFRLYPFSVSYLI